MSMKTVAVLSATGAVLADQSHSTANPIRKVVTLLQNMQGKIETEGAQQKEVHDKYMCYCQTAGATLQGSIDAAGNKIPQLQSQLKESSAQKVQFEQELKDHQSSRGEAKQAMQTANSLRAKEAAAFAKESGDLQTNVDALSAAIKALEGGMAGGVAGGAFLQNGLAQTVERIAIDADMQNYERQVLVSFLAGKSTNGYSPASGQIVGILKNMKDTMVKELSEVKGAEAGAIKTFDEMMAAKTHEVNANTKAIETKTQRIGDLGVEISAMGNDLSDTEKQLAADEEFLANMDGTCAEKKKLYETAVGLRSQELLAIADTIKILNDDDALELFKKTLPGASSLLQVAESSQQLSKKALSMIRQVKPTGNRASLDLISLSLTGRKVNFDKVVGLIDKLVVNLGNEQVDDDNKKEYCDAQFDTSDDKRKGLAIDISDNDKAATKTSDRIATLTEELKALADGITALDKQVAEETANRKEAHADYKELMASDGAAKELLGIAKNRLNKFYNPKLYKAPPKRVLSEEDSITVNFGGTLAPTAAPGGIAGTGVTAASFVQVRMHNDDSVAPPPPPGAVTAYQNKGEMNNGILRMLDMLVADLDKEMQQADVQEKDDQAEYIVFTKEAAAKRIADSKSITDKEEDKANSEGNLQKLKDEGVAKMKEMMATEEYIGNLHAECDWLLSNFQLRKDARAGEVESLKKAKAVLSGADFSLIQVRKTSLRGA